MPNYPFHLYGSHTVGKSKTHKLILGNVRSEVLCVFPHDQSNKRWPHRKFCFLIHTHYRSSWITTQQSSALERNMTKGPQEVDRSLRQSITSETECKKQNIILRLNVYSYESHIRRGSHICLDLTFCSRDHENHYITDNG